MLTKNIREKRFGAVRDHRRKSLVITAIASIFFTACSRDKEADTTSPRYYILESEKVVIPAAIEVPANLPKGNTREATFFAEGFQQYKSRPKNGSNPVVYEWLLVAPQEDLFDINNRRVGTHGAGPFWQLSAADSIYAQAFNPPKSAPGSDAATIDWLLLMPKTGKVSTGVFTNVFYIQRIATRGAKAHATAPVTANETVDVKYTAVYRFTRKNY